MISTGLYSIYDRTTGFYGEIFHAVNVEDAKRKFAYSFRSMPFRDDLVLYSVGLFNPDDGVVTPCKPDFVCNYSELCEGNSNE